MSRPDKPGSVVDNHSSRTYVTARLKQPTRPQRGPRQWGPIWSCSGWSLPCHELLPVARCALTAPFHPYLILQLLRTTGHRRFALCCTGRRLTPPRRYLAPCPVEPGLSSPYLHRQRLSWPTHSGALYAKSATRPALKQRNLRHHKRANSTASWIFSQKPTWTPANCCDKNSGFNHPRCKCFAAMGR